MIAPAITTGSSPALKESHSGDAVAPAARHAALRGAGLGWRQAGAGARA
jgi:hypothetical protein